MPELTAKDTQAALKMRMHTILLRCEEDGIPEPPHRDPSATTVTRSRWV